MVLPLRERFDAPLMSKVDSGLVICPLRFEAPLSSMSSFSFARKSPPTSILLAPERTSCFSSRAGMFTVTPVVLPCFVVILKIP